MLVEFPKAQVCANCETASHRFLGDSITYKSCKGCGDPLHSGSTLIDKYCVLCAIDYNICPHCGKEHEN